MNNNVRTKKSFSKVNAPPSAIDYDSAPSNKGTPVTGKFRIKVAKVVKKLQPYASTAEKIAGLAVHMRKPTLLNSLGLVSSGLNSLASYVDGIPSEYTSSMYCGIPLEYIIKGLRNYNIPYIIKYEGENKAEMISVAVELPDNKVVFTKTHWAFQTHSEKSFLYMREVLSSGLPHSMTNILGKSARESTIESISLAPFSTKQGKEIIRQTKPLLDSGKGRCILLEGRPGVGKSCIAQEIARDFNIGRTIIFKMEQSDPESGNSYTGHIAGVLSCAQISVAILDDVDKLGIDIYALETLRQFTKLVILTANNGKYDDVLDGATTRPGRIDEVFTIVPEHKERTSPFDRLTDDQWEKVRDWPIASQNELALRMTYRDQADWRLADIEERIDKRISSGKNIF